MWHERSVGDRILLAPHAGLRVGLFHPSPALAFEGWGAFIVMPGDAFTSRVIVRSRGPPGTGSRAATFIDEIPHTW